LTTTHDHPTGAPLVSPGSGRVLMDGPLGAVLLAGTADTHGAVSLVVHPIAPRTLGSPVHTHTHEDEWTYVLESRGVAHAFWNATDGPARLLEVITRGGFETYFEGLGRILADPEPDLAALAAAECSSAAEVRGAARACRRGASPAAPGRRSAPRPAGRSPRPAPSDVRHRPAR